MNSFIYNNSIFDFKTNAWFAGFFDGDGSMSIRNEYTLTISIGQKDRDILERIKDSMGYGNIYYDKSWNGHAYSVTDIEGIKFFINYFEQYPL